MMYPWLISISTILIVLYVERVENKYLNSGFDYIPAILLAYIIPAIISYSFSVDYSGDQIHSFSKSYVIPRAIITVMIVYLLDS